MSKPPSKPIFGLEIEVFVKVKPEVERDVLEYRRDGEPLPLHWQTWDFDLSNKKPPSTEYAIVQARQRARVKSALSALIQEALGRRAGWKVVGDASLQEWRLTQAPDSSRWCKSSRSLSGA